MKLSKVEENDCRICLEQKGNINWTNAIVEFCGVSFKDCYYKYTKLEEMDTDLYPTNLCGKCAKDLRGAHMLFEKALESFKILQNIDRSLCNKTLSAIKREIQTYDEVSMAKKIMEKDDEQSVFNLSANELLKSEDRSNDSNKTDVSRISPINPTHFINIHNFGSSVEIPFEEHFSELYDSEIPISVIAKKVQRKRKNVNSVLLGSPKHSENTHASSFNTTKMSKRKRSTALSSDILLKKNNDYKSTDVEIIEGASKDENLFKNLETKAAKNTKKSRGRYLLCSYCSLTVSGAKKLEIHEATHNENRKRTVTCPECGLKLYTDLALNVHMKTHDINRQRNHKCEFCEKAFFNKGALNVHRRIHLGLMIKCQICEKEFYRQVDLDKHLLKHSASPLQKNVGKKKCVAECQYCNKSILTEKFKEHIALHLNQPQMKCKICDKKFYSRTKCTRHLRRFHLKHVSEYEQLIHYYVDRNKRLSNLMIQQQLMIPPLK